MIQGDSKQFNKPLYILYPGEFHATTENCMLGTVLESCVAVCLYDPQRKVGAMSHFIIPGAMGTEGIVSDAIAQRGILNIEFLMGEIVKLGGDRRYLTAKLFGAGNMPNSGGNFDLSNSNIRFLYEYFTLEKIPVERSDLGGDFRRRIYFSTNDGKVFRKILKNNDEHSEFSKMEKEYIDREFRDRDKTGKVILFD